MSVTQYPQARRQTHRDVAQCCASGAQGPTSDAMASSKRVNLASVVKAGLEAKAARGSGQRTEGIMDRSLDDIIKSRRQEELGATRAFVSPSKQREGTRGRGRDAGVPRGRGVQAPADWHGAAKRGRGRGRGRGSHQQGHGLAGHHIPFKNAGGRQLPKQRQHGLQQHGSQQLYADAFSSEDFDGDTAAHADYKAGYEATQWQGGRVQKASMGTARPYSNGGGLYDEAVVDEYAYASGMILQRHNSYDSYDGQQYQLQQHSYPLSRTYAQGQGSGGLQVQDVYGYEDEPRYMQVDGQRRNAAYTTMSFGGADYQEPMVEQETMYATGGYAQRQIRTGDVDVEYVGSARQQYREALAYEQLARASYRPTVPDGYPQEQSSSYEDMPPITRQAAEMSQYEYEQDSVLKAPARQHVEPMQRESMRRSSRPPSIPLPQPSSRHVEKDLYGHQEHPERQARRTSSHAPSQAPSGARPASQASNKQPAASQLERISAGQHTRTSHAATSGTRPRIPAPEAAPAGSIATRRDPPATGRSHAIPAANRQPIKGPTASATAPAAVVGARQPSSNATTASKLPRVSSKPSASRPAAATTTPRVIPTKRKHQPIVFPNAQPAGEEDMLEGLAEEFKDDAPARPPQKAVKRAAADTAPATRRPAPGAAAAAASMPVDDAGVGGTADEDEYEPGGDMEHSGAVAAGGPSDPRQHPAPVAVNNVPQDPRRGAASGSRPAPAPAAAAAAGTAAGGVVGDGFFVAPPTVFRNATEATDAMLPSMKTVFRPDAGIIEHEPMSLDDIAMTILACCDVLSKHAGQPIVLPLRKMQKMQQHMQAGMAFVATSDFGSSKPNAQVIIRCSQASLKDPLNMSMWTNLLEYGKDLVDSDSTSQRAFAFIKHQLQHQADWNELFQIAPGFYQLDQDKQAQLLLQYAKMKQQQQALQLQQEQQQPVQLLGQQETTGTAAAAAAAAAAAGPSSGDTEGTADQARAASAAAEPAHAGAGTSTQAPAAASAGQDQQAAAVLTGQPPAADAADNKVQPAEHTSAQQVQHTAVIVPKREPADDA